MGGWLHFQELGVLSATVLASFSGLLHDVRGALEAKAPSVVLSNIDIAMDHLSMAPNALPFALFIGTGSQLDRATNTSVQRRSLSDCLKWNTRHVTLLPVDTATMLEASFRCDL